MERDIFIISTYCLVARIMQIIEKSNKFRARGFPPKFTDAEVITMEICGEFFKIHEDSEIYSYFKRHYLDYFPIYRRALLLSGSQLTFGKSNSYVNLWSFRRLTNSLIKFNR